MWSTDALIDDFAIRCLRETADQDYIAARLAHRHTLLPQFLWSGLQAIEKYLKCILVLNRLKAPKTHKLSELLDVLARDANFDVRISGQTREFLSYLTTHGVDRYFEASWFAIGYELMYLDCAVWEIRRYARVLDVRPTANLALAAAIEDIESAEKDHPSKYRIPGGLLEDVIDNKAHAARPALIWQNAFYSSRRRQKVKVWPGLRAANAPLFLHPEILGEIQKYVWLSKEATHAYRQQLAAKEEKRR